MIPIALTIQGLYSYRGKQIIDFTKLTQDGLFGIFGSVGSGKSSILEAISFALYEESERLNARENRSYNMMNLKSNELLIDFEFKSNTDIPYRFLVRGKRNSKKFDDVKSFERTAYKREADQWVPIDPKTIEEITGLNYKNFRRTIIIPQGRFQEFLQLNASDRTTMLKELFNLSKYELSDKVGGLESKNNAAIQKVQGQLEEVGDIKPERIAELKKSTVELKELSNTLKEELTQSQQLDQELDNLKVLAGKIAEQKKAFAALQNNHDSFELLEREVKEFESFSLLFKSDLEQLNIVDHSLQKGVKDIEQHRIDLTVFQKKSTELKTVFEALKIQYDARERLIQEAGEIRKYAEIRESKLVIETCTLRLEKGKAKVQETINSIATKRLGTKTNEGVLITLKKDLPNLKLLAEISEWFVTKRNLLKSKHNLQSKIEEGLEVQQRFYRQAVESINTSNTGLASVPIPAMLVVIERSNAERELQIKVLDSEILKLEIQHQLEHYAAELHDGKPCPLCGSENHPDVLNPKDVSKQLTQSKQRKNDIQGTIKDHIKLEKVLTGIQTQLTATEIQQSKISKEILLLEEQVAVHEKSFKWIGFDLSNESFIKNEFERYDELQKQISDTEKRIKEDIAFIEAEETNREKYAKALLEIEQEIANKRTKIELLTGQIKLINLSDFESFSDKQLHDLALARIEKYESVSKKYQQLDQELTDLTAAINTLTGIIASTQKTNDNLLTQKISIRDRIETKLRSNANVELSTVIKILGKAMDIEASKAKVDAYKQEVESLRKYLEQLILDLNGRIYNEESHSILKLQVQSRKETLEVKNQELWKDENELKQLKLLIKRFALLKEGYDQLQLRGKDIAELKNLFRASSFVNFVSTVYLQNLCKAANDRFYKLTRQKMGLELADDNSFYVRDYMNEGKLRSVKTLSGGQTFQASLSLALSLADSIHKIAGSAENFFFLDEGFGTLDKDSLDVVFDSLKALRKENRIVGVISHVEDMQQEIETYLKVTNDEEKGSQIVASWDI